jgi:methylated-DNA-[protein]-cysteine S-methyltransferase
MPERLYTGRTETPLGAMIMVADRPGTLLLLEFEDKEDRWAPILARRFADAVFDENPDPFGFGAILARYFAGDIAALSGIAVGAHGTDFQHSVWRTLREIPAGTTTSYGALARQLGKPAAMRAVGLANGANPIAIVVPCHRVIGSDGSLTGYGGGLERKRWLLAHEARHAGQDISLKARHA